MKKALTIIIALVAISSFAFAQQGGGQRGQGGGKGQGQGNKQGGQTQRQGGSNGVARLLAMPIVQTELNLTVDQKSKLTALIPQRGQGEQGANRANQADLDKKIADILDDKQEERLAELVIQRAGNRAVLDEKVAAKLAVTVEQKAQLAALREKLQGPRGGQKGQGADREAARAAREKMEKELDAEIDKILTEKQKAELKTLGGKPFKFEN